MRSNIKDENLGLKITLSVRQPSKEVERWAKKLQDEKQRIQAKKAIEASDKAEEAKVMF